MSRVLITGVAGFLGSHLADRFLDNGDEVIGIDNLIGGYRHNIPKGVTFYELDLADLSAIQTAFIGVDTVVHAACTAYEGLSVFSPALIVQNTMQITATALSAAVNNKVKKFVYCSSMARYGTQDEVPFRETMTPRPQDPYGIAKVAAEQLVQNVANTHGLDWVIMVPHNIIGPRQKYDDPYRNVASIMINRMLSGKQPIIYGTGDQKRCFSFIQDTLDPLMKACIRNDVHEQIVNIGPDEEFISINQLAVEIALILNFDLDPIYMPGRPQEVFHANCSANKARELLDYKTTTSLRDGLTELAEWIKQQGSKPFEYHLPIEFTTSRTPKTWTDKLM
jgi:UDP-glucose 4-epimerase